MNNSKISIRARSGFRPLLIVALAMVVAAGCKESVQQSGGGMPAPGGGMPSPGGGMPSPGGGSPSPGGGTPSPSGGDSGSESGGDSRGESGGEAGGSSGGFPSGGSSGGESGGFPTGDSSGGEQGGSSTSSGDAGGGGDVGQIPPPPSQRGAGGGTGEGSEGADSGEGGSDEDNPFADPDAEGQGECGDSGVLPGGVGGMGQAGECIGGGGGASESDSDAAAAGGAAGGGSASAGGASGSGAAGSVGQFPEESAEERAARLGRELDESIGGFDEALHEEQQEIAATGRVLEGFDIGTGGGADDDESGELISLGTQRRSGPSGGPQEGGSVGGKNGIPEIDGMSEQQIEERTPDDIPVAVDDDIIARQLREAALTEDDPVLRERLWDEYRKYRGLLTTN